MRRIRPKHLVITFFWCVLANALFFWGIDGTWQQHATTTVAQLLALSLLWRLSEKIEPQFITFTQVWDKKEPDRYPFGYVSLDNLEITYRCDVCNHEFNTEGLPISCPNCGSRNFEKRTA